MHVPTPETAPKKSYEDYLHDVAGESHELEEDEELRRLDTSQASPHLRANDRSQSQQRRQTPLSGMASPQLTEARSFVNGLLSPFSPLLKQREQREEFLEFVSLRPCRKVSIVVRVLPCDESEQRCLFPHVKSNNDVIQKPKSPHDMVVVKPSAFGKVIPSQVTMETARLVAQVAHISSEDWARLYEFHHVMWPDPLQQDGEDQRSNSTNDPDQFSTMDSLSRAVVQDALVERQSSLLISMGQAPACIEPQQNFDSSCLFAKIVAHCQRLMEPKAVATISMVELREEKDSFRDLFNRKNKAIFIRHHDMKGAVLEGLTQVHLDDLADLWPTIQKQKQKHTIVATISIWDNAISQELKRAPDSEITCIELARSSDPTQTSSKSSSTVSLGLALRQLLIHASFGTDPAISYRESTITKVLQRSLESSKIALIASVSQLSQDYEATLVTLNFLRSLLVKPGKTASSPFNSKDQPEEETTNIADIGAPYSSAATDQLQQYANDESLLEQIIADPRQRLAKIFKQSPPRSTQPEIPIESQGSVEEEYHPIDYMQGLDVDVPAWESPAPAREEAREPSTSRSTPQIIVLQDGEQPEDLWSMEEPEDKSRPFTSDELNFSNISSTMHEFTPQHERQLFEEQEHAVSAESTGKSQDVSHEASFHDPIQEPEFNVATESIKDDDQAWVIGDGQSEIGENLGGYEEAFDVVLLEGGSNDEVQLEDAGKDVPRDLSEEIIFQEGWDPSEEPSEEPMMTLEWQSQSDQSEALHPQSQIEYDLRELKGSLENGTSHPESSIVDSFISRSESRSSLPSPEGRSRIEALPSDQEGGRSGGPHSPQIGIRQDTEWQLNSAFQSVSPSKQSPASHYGSGPTLERNGYAFRIGLNQRDGEQYLDDINVLEGAVRQFQNMQSGLWRSSADSLSKLRNALSHQHHEITVLADEREVLSNIVAGLKDEIKKISEEHDRRLQRYEEEAQQLENQLNDAISERKKVENAVDRATSAGNEMKIAMANIESEFEETRRELLTLKDSHYGVMNANSELKAEITKVTAELNELKREKEAIDRTCASLQHTLATVEEESTTLTCEASAKENTIRALTSRLNENEKNHRELQEHLREVEKSRRQEALELERLKFSNRSLSSSVEESHKERTILEEGRLRDRGTIERLQKDLQERISSYDDVESDKRTMKTQIDELEQRLSFADEVAATREISIARLKERCQHLEEKNIQDGSDKSYWEEQRKKQNRVIEKLEDEVRKLTRERQSDEVKIDQLEDRLGNEESARLENERLREKFMQSERERKELDTVLTRYKTEYYDEAQRKSREIAESQNRADQLEHEVQMLKQREIESSSMRDGEISRLQREVEAYMAKLEASNTKVFNLELQVRTSEDRLSAMNDTIERYRSESIRAEEELNAARDNERKGSDVYVQNLKRRIEELEGDLNTTTQEREMPSEISQEEHSTHRFLSIELERTREELSATRRDLRRLEHSLEESESERSAQEKKLSMMRKSVDELQVNTRERFELFVNERKDFTRLTDSLKEEGDRLRTRLSNTERERDACRRCLEVGRKKLSHLLKNCDEQDFLEAQIFGPMATLDGGPAVDSIPCHLSTDIYITDHPVDRYLALRAEEIVSCLAVSAKASLQDSQDENSNLRSRMHSIEEGKRAEVASLKNRIKFLEREVQRPFPLV